MWSGIALFNLGALAAQLCRWLILCFCPTQCEKGHVAQKDQSKTRLRKEVVQVRCSSSPGIWAESQKPTLGWWKEGPQQVLKDNRRQSLGRLPKALKQESQEVAAEGSLHPHFESSGATVGASFRPRLSQYATSIKMNCLNDFQVVNCDTLVGLEIILLGLFLNLFLTEKNRK